jgi:hypothetical protein
MLPVIEYINHLLRKIINQLSKCLVAPSSLRENRRSTDRASPAIVDPLPDAGSVIYMMTIFEFEKVIIVYVELIQAYCAILPF